MNQQQKLLQTWAENIQKGVLAGKFGKAQQQLAFGFVTGPRIGGLDIIAREDPAGLKKALVEQDGLNVAGLVPWSFPEGHVNIFSHGRVIRVECPWPYEMAKTDISLKTIMSAAPKHIYNGWIAGTDDQGRIIVPNFFLEPHWGFFGQTGGGKSVAITTAVAQLALHSGGRTKIVLIDGKGGESLSAVSILPGIVGPPAYDLETTALALAWVVGEMAKRYEVLRTLDNLARQRWNEETPRIVLVIDEIQTITQRPEFAQQVSLLLQQGRAAKINLIISTQHPVNEVLGGNTMKTNLAGRVVFKMNSATGSQLAIGSTEPDARNLLGRGDCYIVASGSFARVQIAYLSLADFAQIPPKKSEFTEWPAVDGLALPDDTTAPSGYSAQQLAIALDCARTGVGRPTLKKRLDEAGVGKIGMQKLYALQKLVQEVHETMQNVGGEG